MLRSITKISKQFIKAEMQTACYSRRLPVPAAQPKMTMQQEIEMLERSPESEKYNRDIDGILVGSSQPAKNSRLDA